MNNLIEWVRASTRNTTVAVVVVLAVVVCCCGGSLAAVLNQGSTTTPQQANVSVTNTPSGPTDTPQPPTATPKPKPTPTLEQTYTAMVKSHTDSDQVQVSYDASQDSLMVDDNIGEQLNVQVAVLVFRGHDFDIFQDIYTHARHKPATITIRTLGPSQDQYGNTTPDSLYAVATLDQSTATLFNWSNLTQDDAWNDYDVHLETPIITNG